MTPGCASPVIFGQSTVSHLSHKWTALHHAARVIAALAWIEPEAAAPEVEDFPAAIQDAAPWRRDLADRGVEDIAAMMQPGVAALINLDAGGGDPRAAALALWREFIDARAAVLTLLPPDGALQPESGA